MARDVNAPPTDRLRELAIIGAGVIHDDVLADVPLGGDTQGHTHADTAICLHPDCVLVRETGAAQPAKHQRTACDCVEPDPVMQADHKFYCYTCSSETGARPRNLEPEDAIRRTLEPQPKIDLEAIRARYRYYWSKSLAEPRGLPLAQWMNDTADLLSEVARLTQHESELTHYINTLVASSIATHLILKTPSETMSLQESAQRVVDRLALAAPEQDRK